MEVGVQYLLEGSIKSKCDIETTTRSLLLYHHFIRCVGDVYYDVAVVAAAALHLSSKIGEKELKVDNLVILFYHIVNKTLAGLSIQGTRFYVLRKSIISVQFIMLRMLEFTLNHEIAHRYFVPFMSALMPRSQRIEGFQEAMSETCVRLMSDFYTDKMCLNYKPEHIAVACIDAGLHIHGFLIEMDVIHPWYDGFCSDLSDEKIKEIKLNIFKLYKRETNNIERPVYDLEDITSSSDSDDEVMNIFDEYGDEGVDTHDVKDDDAPTDSDSSSGSDSEEQEGEDEVQEVRVENEVEEIQIEDEVEEIQEDEIEEIQIEKVVKVEKKVEEVKLEKKLNEVRVEKKVDEVTVEKKLDEVRVEKKVDEVTVEKKVDEVRVEKKVEVAVKEVQVEEVEVEEVQVEDMELEEGETT